jgi:hypothetical protein
MVKTFIDKAVIDDVSTRDYKAIKEILESAHWAPSGDNAQPWSIKIESESVFRLDLTKFVQNTYNLLPIPDWIAVGMFIENTSIAAQNNGFDLTYTVSETEVRATIHKADGASQNSLFPFIKTRSVNRFPYQRKALDSRVKSDLASVFDDDMVISWFEDFQDRFSIAKLMMLTTDIRLRTPATYPIHKDLIDWSGKDSPDKLPYGALGLRPSSLKMLRWALATQRRNRLLMKLPGTTIATQLELDLIPALRCSAHFIVGFDPKKTPKPTVEDYIRAGRAMQRFWLSIAQNAMAMQPWYITFMFSRYVKDNIKFTENPKKAERLKRNFETKILAPNDISLDHIFFTGRVGYPTITGKTRSVRKPLGSLLVE